MYLKDNILKEEFQHQKGSCTSYSILYYGVQTTVTHCLYEMEFSAYNTWYEYSHSGGKCGMNTAMFSMYNMFAPLQHNALCHHIVMAQPDLHRDIPTFISAFCTTALMQNVK